MISKKVLLSDGSCATIENVVTTNTNAPESTYNIEVENCHTYFVGDRCVLVHNRCSGSYDITFDKGMHYVGKGNKLRSRISAKFRAKKHSTNVVSIDWTPAPNSRQGFIDEANRMLKYAKTWDAKISKVDKLYNEIWSPGKKYLGH